MIKYVSGRIYLFIYLPLFSCNLCIRKTRNKERERGGDFQSSSQGLKICSYSYTVKVVTDQFDLCMTDKNRAEPALSFFTANTLPVDGCCSQPVV